MTNQIKIYKITRGNYLLNINSYKNFVLISGQTKYTYHLSQSSFFSLDNNLPFPFVSLTFNS